MKKELKIIGKPTPKIDAKVKVTGKAVYGHDITLPNMLYGAILRTKHSVAEIKSIDISKALKLPGVVCVITADDVDALPIEDALVTAYKGDEEITSTATDADGQYTLLGLPAGEYRLEFSAAGFDDAEVTGLVVEADQTVEDIDVPMTPEDG